MRHTQRLNRLRICAALYWTIAIAGAMAQTSSMRNAGAPSVKVPAYDVVTIKPNRTGSNSVSANFQGDTYSATNVSLKMMMQNAYDIKLDLIFGLTGWAESARFDVQAKIVDPDKATMKRLTDDQRREMLRQLLEDRFGLKVHKEARLLPDYELVIAKGGPKIQQVEPPPLNSEDDKQKTFDGVERGNMRMGSTQLFAHDVALSTLTSMLSHQLHRPVLDKTGLKGKFDLALTWTLDDSGASNTDAAPYLLTALQEQMGLKLVPSKGTVETLIVDSVEVPTEN